MKRNRRMARSVQQEIMRLLKDDFGSEASLPADQTKELLLQVRINNNFDHKFLVRFQIFTIHPSLIMGSPMYSYIFVEYA